MRLGGGGGWRTGTVGVGADDAGLDGVGGGGTVAIGRGVLSIWT